MMEPSLGEQLRKMLTSAKVSAGTSEEYLQKLMTDLGYRLPEDYLAFMCQWNGYNGDVGTYGTVNIWAAEEILPVNQANHFREWIQGFVLFGSDGGGEFYAFDMRHEPPNVVMIPSISLKLDEAIDVGDTFLGFLERLAQSPCP
jgi:hypothetical protein